MFSKIANFFRSEEDNNPSYIQLTRNILLFVIAANALILPLVTGIAGEGSKNLIAFLILSISLLLEFISLVILRRGRVGMAKVIVPVALVISISVIAMTTNGLRDISIIALPIILTVSAILLGQQSRFLTLPLTIAAIVWIAVADIKNPRIIHPVGIDDAIIAPVLLIVSAGITQLLISRLNESTEKARQSEAIQRQENIELNELRASLEERVKQRTDEIAQANLINERRARQFRAVTQVMNVVSSIQALETLLPEITRVISEEFQVYHCGIFLIDDQREFAVLRASNSEGGRRMLARNHKLRFGQAGIVGFVVASGQPRIALDVGTDAIYFDNPDLFETRSEIALPLRYTGQIIGALDVQSTDANAFTKDDVEVLTALADQVAVAINNARTIEEAKKTLIEAQNAVRQTTGEAWQVLRPKSLALGFSYVDSNLKPLEKPIQGEHIQEAIQKGERIITLGDHAQKLAVPIRLRGQVVGVMHLSTRNDYKLTDDDADIAEAVAERLSLAIETATLLQATQHRADIERVTATITSQISSSTRFETILKTAAQELSRALGGSDVLVQIEPAALKMHS
ncbi:MAG TPA: GAF domain-containing protein [Anaerolineales bacterium]|nr:GAF domain-containing protein [Anaerolineales bacterium]